MSEPNQPSRDASFEGYDPDQDANDAIDGQDAKSTGEGTKASNESVVSPVQAKQDEPNQAEADARGDGGVYDVDAEHIGHEPGHEHANGSQRQHHLVGNRLDGPLVFLRTIRGPSGAFKFWKCFAEGDLPKAGAPVDRGGAAPGIRALNSQRRVGLREEGSR